MTSVTLPPVTGRTPMSSLQPPDDGSGRWPPPPTSSADSTPRTSAADSTPATSSADSPPPTSSADSPPAFHFPPLPDDYPRIISRPSSVFAGCVMAGLGGAVGLMIGLFLLSLSASSPALAGLPPADRADTAQALRLVGAVSVVWCPLVMVAAYFAYRGARWAAWTLVGMATVYVLAAIIGSSTGSSATPGGIGIIWALASAALVYATRPAREWFRAMNE